MSNQVFVFKKIDLPIIKKWLLMAQFGLPIFVAYIVFNLTRQNDIHILWKLATWLVSSGVGIAFIHFQIRFLKKIPHRELILSSEKMERIGFNTTDISLSLNEILNIRLYKNLLNNSIIEVVIKTNKQTWKISGLEEMDKFVEELKSLTSLEIFEEKNQANRIFDFTNPSTVFGLLALLVFVLILISKTVTGVSAVISGLVLIALSLTAVLKIQGLLSKKIIALISFIILTGTLGFYFWAPSKSVLLIQNEPFVSDEAAFSVLFPYAPEKSKQDIKTKLGNAKFFKYAAANKALGHAYMVTAIFYPDNVKFNAQNSLDGIRDGLISEYSIFPFEKEEDITVLGYPARELIFKKNNAAIRTRVVIANHQHYLITIVGQVDFVFSESADSFLNSFKHNKPPTF
jgi:hypothetical protein